MPIHGARQSLLVDEQTMRTAPRVASDLFSTSYRNYLSSDCDFLTAQTISKASPTMRRCATIREGQIDAFVLFLRRRVCSQRFLPSSAGRNLPGQQGVLSSGDAKWNRLR